MYEVDLPDYYYCRIYNPIDDYYVYCHCRIQQYKNRKIQMPSSDHNQQESIGLEEINKNMQTYFTHELNISNIYHIGFLALQESMSNLEI